MNSERKWSKKGRWYYIPKAEYLNKLFMRKSVYGIKVHFPDTEQPYWNTFYQQITYNKITTTDQNIEELTEEQSLFITAQINDAIDHGQDFRYRLCRL
jgi:sucrose phosphorylase